MTKVVKEIRVHNRFTTADISTEQYFKELRNKFENLSENQKQTIRRQRLSAEVTKQLETF